MQDVNNDMDDLFRKAAEQYPLKTDGADWQKVFAGLQDTSMPAAAKKEKRNRRALWLLLLLPVALLWGIYDKSVVPPAQRAVSAKQVVKDNAHNNDLDSRSGLAESSSKAVNKNDGKPFLSSGKTRNILTTTKASNKNTLPDHNNIISVHTKGISNQSFSPLFITGNKIGYPIQKQVMAGRTSAEENNKKNELILQPSPLTDRIDKSEANGIAEKEGIVNRIQEKVDSVALNNVKKDSTESTAISNKSTSKLIIAKSHTKPGFYAGLLASFDVSTVKLQRINKTGHGFELLVGYRFSKRLSVESGINWTAKKYYSTGKYFDKTNTGISPQSKIIYTNGSCTMYEIPATLKYDFAQKKKSNWFATAGLSSYIMKEEKYSYYANHSGNYYSATKKYSHSGSNLFSVASFSIGYQLQLNKRLSLRAEPYIKMPLSGIGIAKMPLTSAGISIGFTRSF